MIYKIIILPHSPPFSHPKQKTFQPPWRSHCAMKLEANSTSQVWSGYTARMVTGIFRVRCDNFSTTWGLCLNGSGHKGHKWNFEMLIQPKDVPPGAGRFLFQKKLRFVSRCWWDQHLWPHNHLPTLFFLEVGNQLPFSPATTRMLPRKQSQTAIYSL